ncbi:DUF1810 family protein [Clostridium sp. MCC353]|uniref:DUF1810 family protein n=1 Tax=Clostridium sp. MCC353 TaxID=2592646 RepID=UPI001C02ED9D|nr:DUF1810 family protein [Clostridium sp. MCC353]MBT9775381.1 DUF1810 family protein [Clostridium sp. MCC353]
MQDNKQSLERFLKAQESDYEKALAEIKEGHKRSQWIWYIFPQIQGLGYSNMSQFYAIKDITEAKAYIEHPVSGPRLKEGSTGMVYNKCSDAVYSWLKSDARPDAMNKHVCCILEVKCCKNCETQKRIMGQGGAK